MQKNQGDLYRYPVDGLSRRRQGFKSPWGRQIWVSKRDPPA